MNTLQTTDSTKTELARISKSACYALIVMFICGVFAEFTVRNQLIDWNNAEATSMNIQNSLVIFNLGILAWILIIILDVYLAITFYILFYRHDTLLNLLMAVFRLVYVAVKGAVIVGLILARDSSSLPADVPANETMQLLKMHHYGFAIGLIFFGVHLILLGRILLKVSLIPKVIGMAVLVAGVGYLLNSLITLSGVDAGIAMNIVLVIFIIPMTFAELALGIWLYKRGVNLPAREFTG